MKYKIVSSSDKSFVESEVQKLLNKGWAFHGAVSVIQGMHNIVYTQAMILFEPGDEDPGH